jgi:hypothetical protein
VGLRCFVCRRRVGSSPNSGGIMGFTDNGRRGLNRGWGNHRRRRLVRWFRRVRAVGTVREDKSRTVGSESGFKVAGL